MNINYTQLLRLCLLMSIPFAANTVSAEEKEINADVKMTYVNYDAPNDSYGIVQTGETATSGFNKISNGSVAFGNTSWGVNYITYLQVDASNASGTIVSATLTADFSGSTDNKRATTWGVGYNNSEWNEELTYESADKTITTIGETCTGTQKNSSRFDNHSFDITDAFSNDNDKIVTILIYETAAAGGYIKNPQVTVKYTNAETADYTIKYVLEDGTEIKESRTEIGFVGETPTISEDDKVAIYNEDNTKKYIYTSDNTLENPVEENGTTVVSIKFREAETWNYTLNAIDGNGDILSELSKGQNFEDETFDVPYLKYIEKNGVLYEANANDKQYNYSLTLDENNKIVNINYNTTDIKNVVLYKEAEDIEGLTPTSAGNANIRCSNALGAYNNGESPVKIVTLTPGTYTMTANVLGNAGTNILINYGAEEDWAIATKGYIYSESKDITLDKTTDITMPVCGSSTKCLDYIYIQKTSDKISITDAGVATFTPSVALYLSNAKNIAAYKASVSGTTVKLTKVETVAAGEGVLVRSLNGQATTEDIPVAADAVSTSDGNMFVGTLTDIESLPTDGNGYTNYILYNGIKGLGFYQANNQTVAAGKAYLAVPATSAAKISFFSLDGETVGIEGIESNEEAKEDVYYTISGQRVAAPTKGLYIKNGKKVIVK